MRLQNVVIAFGWGRKTTSSSKVNYNSTTADLWQVFTEFGYLYNSWVIPPILRHPEYICNHQEFYTTFIWGNVGGQIIGPILVVKYDMGLVIRGRIKNADWLIGRYHSLKLAISPQRPYGPLILSSVNESSSRRQQFGSGTWLYTTIWLLIGQKRCVRIHFASAMIVDAFFLGSCGCC